MLQTSITKGLRVLVTAGARGIGRAIAEAFVHDGAPVHICDIDDDALAEARASLHVSATRTEIADDGQVATLFKHATRALGGLDVLVNNAGIAGPTGAVEAIAPADGAAPSTSSSADNPNARTSRCRCCADPRTARWSTLPRSPAGSATRSARPTRRPSGRSSA